MYEMFLKFLNVQMLGNKTGQDHDINVRIYIILLHVAFSFTSTFNLISRFEAILFILDWSY